MKPQDFTPGEQPNASYESLLKPYGTPGEVLALARMGSSLHEKGNDIVNWLWATSALATLADEMGTAMACDGCPSYVNAGTMGAVMIGITAIADRLAHHIEPMLEIGEPAEIGRRGE